MDDDTIDTEMALLVEAVLEDRLMHDGASTMASTFLRALGRIVLVLRRERDEAVEALAKLRADAGTVVSDLHRANQLSREVRQVGIEALETEIAEVRREKAELAERVDGAVARADLLRDIARHERDVYAHVIARLRDALRLDAGASLSDVVKRAEELAALQVGAQ